MAGTPVIDHRAAWLQLPAESKQRRSGGGAAGATRAADGAPALITSIASPSVPHRSPTNGLPSNNLPPPVDVGIA